MPGGPELLIVLIVIAVAVVIVVVAQRFATPSSTVIIGDSTTIRLASDGRSWLVAVSGQLHRLNAHSVDWLSADVLQVKWRHRSGWTIVIAIVLFPIGLLALLFTTNTYGTIAIVDNGAESTVRLGGEFSNAAVDAINALVPD